MPRRVASTVALLAALAACGGGPAPSPSAPPTATPAAASSAPPPASAAGCAAPAPGNLPPLVAGAFVTAFAFAPDGRLFFAERAGTVRVYQGGASRVFATVPTVTTEPGGGYSERGLLGLALSPHFAQDHHVFAFYSDADRAHQHVIRWADCGGTATAARILVTLPAGPDCCHKGGRLAFGPDGDLYVTLGDEHDAAAAQDTSDVRGKVLRYTPDGAIPPDNPFGPANPVWAYGFRNPFGLAFWASGQLAVTSNGPSGDAGSPATGYDLLFSSVVRGGGYLWPLCYGYEHVLQGACPASQHGPDWSSEPSTVIPTGAAFIDDSGPLGLAGRLVFATYGGGLRIVTPGSPHATVTAGDPRCRLDVVESPSHSVYCSDEQGIHHIG